MESLANAVGLLGIGVVAWLTLAVLSRRRTALVSSDPKPDDQIAQRAQATINAFSKVQRMEAERAGATF